MLLNAISLTIKRLSGLFAVRTGQLIFHSIASNFCYVLDIQYLLKLPSALKSK